MKEIKIGWDPKLQVYREVTEDEDTVGVIITKHQSQSLKKEIKK